MNVKITEEIVTLLSRPPQELSVTEMAKRFDVPGQRIRGAIYRIQQRGLAKLTCRRAGKEAYYRIAIDGPTEKFWVPENLWRGWNGAEKLGL